MTPETASVIGLAEDEYKAIRTLCDDDPFLFAKFICGHRDLTEGLHRPLIYVAAGLAEKLVPLLEDSKFQSFAINQIRRELVRHNVDWRTPEGVQRMRELFTFVNIRVARGFGKSSSLTHAVRLWKMTRDPNLTSALITNVDDPKAKDFCKQIRATVLSDRYRAIYPDRVPADLKLLTESRITLAGRTVPDMEPCLMAFGFKTSPVGYHFDEIHLDDLVARENRSPLELAEVRDFLANLSGLYKPGIRRPIVRTHVGTRWDEEDDDAEVRKVGRCFTINIPIWYRAEPVEDITIPGIPTASDWKDLAAIIDLQQEVLANPQEGAIAWRCNYELDPAIGGGRIFSSQLVDASDWVPFRDPTLTKGREWVARELRDEKGERLINPDTGRVRMLTFDPMKLYRVTTCDQSFSESGDEWCVGTVGMDQYGHRYVLEMNSGHTEEAMLDEFVAQVQSWKPQRIGQEKIAAAHLLELVITLDRKYDCLRRIEMVPHNNVSKQMRIRNSVAEILKMRRLHLHPRDPLTKVEMKGYKPGPKAYDNRLDVLAMADALLRKSLEPGDGESSYKAKFQRVNELIRQKREGITGVVPRRGWAMR